MSPGAIWAEVEPGFHIELETAIWVDADGPARRHAADMGAREPVWTFRP